MGKNKRTNLSTQHSPLARSQSQTQHEGQGQDQDLLLPVELLAHIFTFYAEVVDNPSLTYPAWLPITHVCRHWRTIALSCAQLWTSITPRLSIRWIKAFMERSGTMLMDFDIRIGFYPIWPYHKICIRPTDIALLLTDFTRVRSLHIRGECRPIIDSLCRLLPVQSFSLCFEDIVPLPEDIVTLPDDIFGRKAPVRCLKLAGTRRIVVPHWLFRSVTHFTSGETIAAPELLNVLRHMSALAYFEFRGRLFPNNDKLSPIQMPQLMNLVVFADAPNTFILLNQLLLLHVGAKRHLMGLNASPHLDFTFDLRFKDYLSPIVEAANGFQHIHISGTEEEGWFRLWTGNAATTWEEAEFCLHVDWSQWRLSPVTLRSFIAIGKALGAARVRRLVVDSRSLGLLHLYYWWRIMEMLPGIEELELSSLSVDTLGGAWTDVEAPAVLPALRRIQIVDSKLDCSSSQYTIIGDPPARRIVRLSRSTEDDSNIAPFSDSEVISAEKELENMSRGLLYLVLGMPGRY